MDTADTPPLVSCLCVTEGRPDKLRRAIRCFLAQTHPNKELLVLFPRGDVATESVLSDFAAEGTLRQHALIANAGLTLGEKRNLSIRLCRGEYFCLWDDDDWYHPERIQVQLAALSRYHKLACLLTHLLLFDVETEQAYLSQTRLWEGSLLCRTSVVSDALRYESASLVEDSAFVNALIASNLVYPLSAANLYVYERHHSNTSGKKLSLLMYEKGQKLPARSSELLRDVLASRFSMSEATMHMNSGALLAELHYFHGLTINMRSEDLARFRDYLRSDQPPERKLVAQVVEERR